MTARAQHTAGSVMRRFLVCIHDASPAHARETRLMIRDLAPLLGRRLSFAVVPNWHGGWPLAAHRAYCDLIRNASDELLLHGYLHRRRRGWGTVTLLSQRSDEMNGLDRRATFRTIERGQRVFVDMFDAPARGFVAPAWQSGHVRLATASALGLEYVVGFFSLESASGRKVPLATATWDCGRWRWLGQIGEGFGSLQRSLQRGVPVLAIHPRDLERGFWPKIIALTQKLLDRGYEPSTPSSLLQGGDPAPAQLVGTVRACGAQPVERW